MISSVLVLQRLIEAAKLGGAVHAAVKAAGGEYDVCTEHILTGVLLCVKSIGR
jgi:hypothetical protein